MIMKKVGIMGGSFDPIHLGHLVVANEVLNTHNLDEIIFVPTGDPPHKNGLKADSFHRLLMVNMAVLTNDKFKVSNFEINNIESIFIVNIHVKTHFNLIIFRRFFLDKLIASRIQLIARDG